MASQIGPARQGLWELLNDSALDPAQRCFGWPDYPAEFLVVLLGLSDPSEVAVLLGPVAATQETFGIEVGIKYHDPSADEDLASSVDAEAFAAADKVRDLVRANRTLRLPGQSVGTVAYAAVGAQRSTGTGRPLADQDQPGSGRMCVIEMTVACTARAT